MRIYTSYFAKADALKGLGLLTISIALRRPKEYKGLQMAGITPRPDMIKRMQPEQYVPEYLAILAKYTPQQVYSVIKEASNGQDVALLCWERPGLFCHRHILANWMNPWLIEENLPTIIEYLI